MKFRTIFILFNVVIGISFLSIFLMPFFLLGVQYSLTVWSRNWPLGLIFIVVFSAFNIFFAMNRIVFKLVEKEDWENLSILLAKRIFEKKQYRNMYVRFLVSTSLNKSDLDMIDRLEKELRENKPQLLYKNAVLFGVVYLLKNDPIASERFFAEISEYNGVDNPFWLAFDHGFSLVLLKKIEEAIPKLEKALESKEIVLKLLSAFLLGTICTSVNDQSRSNELVIKTEKLRTEYRNKFTKTRWSKEVEKARNEVHIVIMTKLIDEASNWLFGEEKSQNNKT